MTVTKILEEFREEVYIPHEVVDGDMCRKLKDGECECGTEQNRKNIESWLESKLLELEKSSYQQAYKDLIQWYDKENGI